MQRLRFCIRSHDRRKPHSRTQGRRGSRRRLGRNRVKIAIAYDILRFEEKALINEAQKLSIPIETLHVDSVSFAIDAPRLSIQEDYRVLLQRCVSHARGLHISAIFGGFGIPTINSYEVAAVCDDK